MKAILTVGCSAAGKTTWASEQTGYIVLSRDDIRREMAGVPYNENLWVSWEFTKENEQAVSKALRRKIDAASRDKQDIIIADTNANEKLRTKLTNYLLDKGFNVELKVFDTPLMECLERNTQRVDEVSEQVILNQWFALNCQGLLKEDIIGDKKVVICDIDGTVAKMTERTPHEYHKVSTDAVRQEVVDAMLGLCYNSDSFPVFVSGRPASCLAQTVEWLHRHVCPASEFYLFMRQTGDYRKDTIVKREIYDTFLAGKEIVAVFDDRPSVVDMWHDAGIKTVFAVADQRNRF